MCAVGLGSGHTETVRVLARVKEWFWCTGHSGMGVEMCAGYCLRGMTKHRRQLVIKGLCSSLKGNCKHLEMARASNKPVFSVLLGQLISEV